MDLLIVSLKYGSLPEALESIKTIVGEHTTVMSLMNGVDSEELIAEQVGDERVLRSLIKVASHKRVPFCGHRDSLPLYGVYSGGDLGKVSPECLQ